MTLATHGLAALLLTGCGKDPVDVPEVSAPTLITPSTSATPSIAPETSVPSADSAVASGAGSGPMPTRTAVRTNGALSERQENSGMPLPGQNNDHSAPLASAKPASAPR